MSASSFIELREHWYPLAFSHALKPGELRKERLFGTPLAVFRTRSGEVGALVDRCPHRNAPLSTGFLDGDSLRCEYHGWAFRTDGTCSDIPCLSRDFDGARRAAESLPVIDDGTLVWAWTGKSEPSADPITPRAPSGSFEQVLQRVEMPGPLPAVVENALDVPHTRFLHGGLFRNDSSANEVDVVVRMSESLVEAEYIGEPRPEGIAGRILAPGGGIVQHWDRFRLPSTAEVEYRIGDGNQIVISTVCAPTTPSHTSLFAVVRFRTRLPDKLLQPIFMPLARRILAQDAAILRKQEANIEEFGEERFSSTELDAIGPRALYIMRAASRGETVEEKEFAPVKIRV